MWEGPVCPDFLTLHIKQPRPWLDRVSPYQERQILTRLVGRDSVEPSAAKFMQDALVWPIFRLLHQTRSHRILPNVFPFFGITFFSSQAMVEGV